ncbi:hypothetical protein N431DRAFT_459263 [Stipitochalara longipes BDJ]|nr:hypothetical protein N431DRAFT_459263 [Stipitochalara longipes BDJ]
MLRNLTTMTTNDLMRCETDSTRFIHNEQITTPIRKPYISNENHDGLLREYIFFDPFTNLGPGEIGVTSAFSTFPEANTPYISSCESFDNNATPRGPFTPTRVTTQHTEAIGYSKDGLAAQSANVMLYNGGATTPNIVTLARNYEGHSVTQPRHRANSSVSTISMSIVPEFMSAGQLLSPRGLTATSKLFEQARSSDSAKAYALRGEEVNVGLGLENVDALNGLVECDDIYEFVHSENCGGIPITPTKNRGTKRRRNIKDVDGEIEGDFVAIGRYYLDTDDDYSSGEDNNEGIAQGGALLEAPTPFPDFDEMKAALLEAAGEVFYTMPIGPMLPGTMEYIQQVRRHRKVVFIVLSLRGIFEFTEERNS